MATQTSFYEPQVDDPNFQDFQWIISQPTIAFDEGLRYFRGVGLMNVTLNRLAKDLDQYGIPYSVIGAVALYQHGYQRFTTDIDVLMTQEGLQAFTEKLIGRGYRPAFTGATKKFRATMENVPIEIIVAGEYPGDGKPKSVVFPDPSECSVVIGGIKTVTLEKLVELKLASGMTGQGRLKDLADVQELIRVVALDVSFAERLHPSVRGMFLELHGGVVQGQMQDQAPHRDI